MVIGNDGIGYTTVGISVIGVNIPTPPMLSTITLISQPLKVQTMWPLRFQVDDTLSTLKAQSPFLQISEIITV